MKPKEPKIDPEFEAFLPYPSDEEYAELRRSIIQEGIRDALVVWEETGILLDGHNRLKIARELKMKYRYVVQPFPNRDAAMAWMASNQLARRNLSPVQIAYFRGKEYLATKQAEPFEKNEKIPSNSSVAQNEQPRESTADILAEKHGVSSATIRRNAELAKQVDAAPNREEILAGKAPKPMGTIAKGKVELFCPKCKRLGPVKGCVQCEELRVIDKRKNTPKKPASGSAKYDWKNCMFHLGHVARSPDAIVAAYPKEVSGPRFKKLITLLEPVVKEFEEWQRELTARGKKNG